VTGRRHCGEQPTERQLARGGDTPCTICPVILARLRREEHRHAEARDLLAPVYSWFTEGFGTADLKDAKALLDEPDSL
jgi:hypothetical protein